MRQSSSTFFVLRIPFFILLLLGQKGFIQALDISSSPTADHHAVQHWHFHSIPIIIDNQSFPVNFTSSSMHGDNGDEDLKGIAREFCRHHDVNGQNCPDLILEEMERYLYCEAPAYHPSIRPPYHHQPHRRTFRFLRPDALANSKELEKFRHYFIDRGGFLECDASEDHYSGNEDALWVLGHVTSPQGDHLFHRLQPHQTLNTFPGPLEVGTKDALYRNLLDYSKLLSNGVPDPSTIRCWDLDQLRDHCYHQPLPSLQGLWVLKQPEIEGGFGVQIIDGFDIRQLLTQSDNSGGSTSDNSWTKGMMLQRYIHAPFLLQGKKFCLGIFVVILGVDPFIVLLHDTYHLVLLTSVDFSYDKSNLVAHLTNRARSRELNPDYDDDAAWVHMERFKKMLQDEEKAGSGISYEHIKKESYRIITNAMLASLAALRRTYFEQMAQQQQEEGGIGKANLFVLWRFDFLFDVTGKAYLLEIEIVPSNVYMTEAVLGDLFSLVGWTAESASDAEEEKQSTPTAGNREAIRKRVQSLLRKANDHMYYDKAAVDLIVDYEVKMSHRRDFVPIVPTSADSVNSPELAYFKRNQALPTDLVLDRWLRTVGKREKQQKQCAAAEDQEGGKEEEGLVGACVSCLSTRQDDNNRKKSFIAQLASFTVGPGLRCHLDLTDSFCSSSRSAVAAGRAEDEALSFIDPVRIQSLHSCELLIDDNDGGQQQQQQDRYEKENDEGDSSLICSFLERSRVIARSYYIFSGRSNEAVNAWCTMINEISRNTSSLAATASRCSSLEDEDPVTLIKYCHQQCQERSFQSPKVDKA